MPNPFPRLLRSEKFAWALLVAAYALLGVRALRRGPTFDFQIYYDASCAIGAGRPLFGDSEPYHELFFYGAVFAIGFRPLAMLSAETALVVWTLVGLLSLVLTGGLVRSAVERGASGGAGFGLRSAWPVVFGTLLYLEALISNFRHGNTNTLLVLFLAVGFFGMLRARPVLAGMAFSMAAAIKVAPIMVLPWLLVRRDWRAVGGFCAGLVLWLGVVPVLYFGFDRAVVETRGWLTEVLLPALGQTDDAPGILTRSGASLPRLLEALFAAAPEPDGGSLIQVASFSPVGVRGVSVGLAALMVLGVIWRTRKVQGDLALATGLVLATPSLVTPTSHLGTFFQGFPLFVVLVYLVAEGRRRAKSVVVLGVGACVVLYAIPVALGHSGNTLFPITVLNLILWVGGWLSLEE